MSVYQSIYDLIARYIYGGVDLTSDMELVATLISTFSCIFLVAFPFFVVILFLIVFLRCVL